MFSAEDGKTTFLENRGNSLPALWGKRMPVTAEDPRRLLRHNLFAVLFKALLSIHFEF